MIWEEEEERKASPVELGGTSSRPMIGIEEGQGRFFLDWLLVGVRSGSRDDGFDGGRRWGFYKTSTCGLGPPWIGGWVYRLL
jgi:hypothetical protein